MKHLLATLALLALLATGVGVIAYQSAGDGEVETALARRDALAWLRAEFGLTDAQYARIKALHEGYLVECEEHCRAIQLATRARNALPPTADAATRAAAEAELARLRQTCETAITAHVRRCAAEMSPAPAARYLALVLPKIADFDHHAPPDPGLNPHRH